MTTRGRPPSALLPKDREKFFENAGDLWVPALPLERVDARSISPDGFFRDYVSQNRPVVLTHLLDACPCLRHWADIDGYLKPLAGDAEVSVNVTPNGRGDAISDGRFVMPWEVKMTFRDFLDEVRERRDASRIPYLSHQNDSLRQQLPALLADLKSAQDGVDVLTDYAAKAFGDGSPDTELEAVNLWVGDERAVSSMHKDFYENLYAVVAGTKTFRLAPPSAILEIDERRFPSGRYVQNEQGGFRVEPDPILVPWVVADAPLRNEIVVDIHAGETLYLPALWYHEATQKELTIAVNVWQNMRFDFKFVYYQMLRDLRGLDDTDDSSEEQSH